MSKRKVLTEEQREANRVAARALRAQLLADSTAARLALEAGLVDAETVNEVLVQEMYTDAQNYEFNTFGQWIKLGRPVKKGEKCRYPVWGQPVDRAQEQAEGEDETTRYWPTCYLFSNAQVSDPLPNPPAA